MILDVSRIPDFEPLGNKFVLVLLILLVGAITIKMIEEMFI